MIEAARERLGDRAELHVADLLDARPRRRGRRDPVDGDLPLDRRPRPALRAAARAPARRRPARGAVRRRGQHRQRPRGGRGDGRRRALRAALRAAGAARGTSPRPHDTEQRLRAAGFAEARAWLLERPVTPDDPHAYLTEINLGAHLERLPEPLRAAFVDEVVERLGGGAGHDRLRAAEHHRTRLSALRLGDLDRVDLRVGRGARGDGVVVVRGARLAARLAEAEAGGLEDADGVDDLVEARRARGGQVRRPALALRERARRRGRCRACRATAAASARWTASTAMISAV